ncbi:DUF3040 domain-containing protein [Streptomyces sp. NPDC058045]|uniref:DUF3040 domain-containing protein n=1 Tax=Streptomyces sp. NPDC058045 TaxID=3346311 RepID=UPI0036E6F7C0
MAAGRLPEREQRILDEMEAALSHDHRLSLRLRALRTRRLGQLIWEASYIPRAFLTAVLALTALVLLVVGLRTADTGVIWAFSVACPLALLCACSVLRRRPQGKRR